MNRVLCLLAIVACYASFALADVPPPPPEPGMKRVPVEHVIKCPQEIPGYKFFPYSGGVGGGEKLGDELKFEKDKGVIVPASSSPSLRTGVVAVPDKVLEELKKEGLAPLLNWRNKDKLPASVIVHETRGTRQDLPEHDPRKKIEIVTTISADEKAGVKFTTEEPPAPAADKKSSSDASPPSSTMFAGIALAGAMMTGGLWFWRKKETA